MEREKFEIYIREVTSHVKFPFDRRAVAKELREHMEDLYEDLLSKDIEEEQAAQLTVDYMGDSEEVGKELNEVHHPLWGWIWLVTRWIARLCVVVLVLWGLIQGISFGETYLQQIEHKNGNVVYTISPVLEAQLYGSVVRIEEIRYYDDGTLEYTYHICQNPWLGGGLGRSGIGAEIYVGEEVCRGNGGLFASNSLFYKKGREWIYDVPPEADRIIFFLGYEKEIEVSLTEGRVMAK
ncbi:permease prefix domain 1-containing protein [Anaerotignum sp.]|uniref:permease prefix domain 1-containing protein n=1 Tax=Anaerotignum sp. TaxID=2039241 RepID=UPI003994E040